MAKIAIDIRLIGRQRTGDETVFFQLTKALIHEHPEHQYVLLTDKSESDVLVLRERLALDTALASVELVSFGAQNRFWWNAVTLPKFFFQREDIAVFHTQYILPFFLPTRLAVVAHIHDVSFARYPEFIGKSDLFFLRLFIPRTVRRAMIAVPSEFTKREVMELYKVPSERVVVIPNASGHEGRAGFEANSEDSQRALQSCREKYRLPEQYLLYVGTLQPRKNIPYLVEVFAAYRKAHPDTEGVKLVLVGNRQAHHFDTRIDETIERLALQTEVLFPGYVEAEDLPLVYQGAKAFVFLSVYEGFGIPLLEALSFGVPVFASDIPVHREIGGEAVTYIPLSDVAKAAQILYTTPVTERGNSRTSEYAWTTSASLLADFYQKISRKL